MFLSIDTSGYHSLKEMRLSMQLQGDDRTELGAAVCFSIQFTQQFLHVGFTIVIGSFGIACRVYAGRTTQCRHFQSCIVGKTVYMVMFGHIASLDTGILFQCTACFGNILMTSYLAQGDNFKLVAQYLFDFFELMGIVGGKYYFHVLLFFFTFTLIASNPSPYTPITAL